MRKAASEYAENQDGSKDKDNTFYMKSVQSRYMKKHSGKIMKS